MGSHCPLLGLTGKIAGIDNASPRWRAKDERSPHRRRMDGVAKSGEILLAVGLLHGLLPIRLPLLTTGGGSEMCLRTKATGARTCMFQSHGKVRNDLDGKVRNDF